jgi:molybdopterin-guanine dinucleotide biosynthesis protein A
MTVSPLHGLLLTGGRSRRMQRDKATLPYDGQPQLVRAMALLQPLVERAFVSVRRDQLQDPARRAYDTIVDGADDLGPLGGIQSALRQHPGFAWLVLACDLPLLDSDTLRYLISHRTPTRLATAFLSSSDGKPEPLCAIYEPAALESIEAWIARDARCPRKWLSQEDVTLLELPTARALDNVNTVAEYAAHTSGGATLHLNVRYFALLREQAGRSAEQIETSAATPAELYEQLRLRHGLTLVPASLRVAINEEFGDWGAPLVDGDTVVFLPPVAGG